MKFKLLFILVLIGLLSSCHKDVVDEEEMTETSKVLTVPYVYQEIEGNVVGYVYDENSSPVSDASVELYSASTTTNAYGVFTLTGVSLDVQGTLIRVEKAGFINASDLIFPSEKGTAISRIQMLKPSTSNFFDSQQGEQFDIGDGKVEFFANTFSTLGSNDYTGTISATIDYLSSENERIGNQMNGGFRGKENPLDDGVELDKVLGGFGIVKIELRGSNGELLKLKDNSSFSIVLPIPEKLLTEAKDTVQLWKYDESRGLWIEKGTANRDGNTYVAVVGQVGDWMFADAYELTQYCARVINNVGLPISNIEFKVFVDNRISAAGISDEFGFICSKVPRGHQLQLRLYNPVCKIEIKEITIGAFGGQVTPEDIPLDIEEDTKTGIVLCGGQSVDDAVIVIEKEDYTTLFVSDQNGSFSVPLSMVICSGDSEYKIYAINKNQESISPILILTQDNVAELKLDVCMGTCNIEAKFEFGKEDWCVPGSYSSAEILVAGGSGEYSYEWADGSIESSNTLIVDGTELCVTIIDDADGCSLEYCELINTYNSITIEEFKASNAACQFDSGIIELSIIDGQGEYVYQWEGPNGFASTEPDLTGLEPGEYYVTVSDDENCIATESVIMHDVILPIEAVIVETCEDLIIRIKEDNGFGPFDYEWSNMAANIGELIVTSDGLYKVTVTDANGCSRTKSWDITLSNISIDSQYSCEGYQLRFSASTSDYDYYYIKAGSADRVPLEELNGWFYIPILESGYSFTYGAQDVNSGCEEEVSLEVPQFYGLSIESVVHTSCDACQDGQILVALDFMADCTSGCTPGEVRIINQQSEEEVTNLNSEGILSAGDYYVMVMSEDGTCVIAHEEVTVD